MLKQHNKLVDVSIVSHGHSDLVSQLLRDLTLFKEVNRILVTVNIPEKPILVPKEIIKKTDIIFNKVAKGFGENHNEALRSSRAKYLCILNPDIQFEVNPFPIIFKNFHSETSICGIKILDLDGKIQDSARAFPTISEILKRSLRRLQKNSTLSTLSTSPDWVAGMFMVIKNDDFRSINGFDEKYFLYVEDADICWRIKKARKKVQLILDTYCIHDARRTSHRDIRFFFLHLRSLIRFWYNYYLNRDKNNGV